MNNLLPFRLCKRNLLKLYVKPFFGTRRLASSGSFNASENDTICELAASSLRFGPGATAEVGQDLAFLKAKRIMVVTDPNIAELPSMQVLLESLERSQLTPIIFQDVRVEPNDVSFKRAIRAFSETSYDAVVALGGGSVMDTAKAANLYAAYPPQNFYDYVNPPLGKGMPVPGPLPPLIAIPTTAGTGSETTGVAIFDDTATHAKTGIANRRLKPTLGIVDSDNTATLPATVATYSGLDVLCHAIESYTALPFSQRSKPASPILRPAYQGANPISDVWSLFALQTTAKYLRRAQDSSDVEARAQMLLASSAAGMGFGNAGVHLCHGMSYPVASQVKTYQPDGYDADHAVIPHGLSVIVNSPAVFSFTGMANPERHATCASILQEARTGQAAVPSSKDTGKWLADEIKLLCQDLGCVPMGLTTFGYTEEDVPSLVQGTLPQHRVTKLSPRPVGEPELQALFMQALHESY
jgi:hydroxyacid-oxoacid transhydrogenase